MSAQLSLDSLSGIDWSCPKLAQLEQVALDHVDGASVEYWNVKDVGMTVLVRVGMRLAWMKPCLQRTTADALEWVVMLDAIGHKCKELRSDAELEAALADVFNQQNKEEA